MGRRKLRYSGVPAVAISSVGPVLRGRRFRRAFGTGGGCSAKFPSQVQIVASVVMSRQCRDELFAVRFADILDCCPYRRVLDRQSLVLDPAGFVGQVDQDLPPSAGMWVSLHETASFEGVARELVSPFNQTLRPACAARRTWSR